MLSVVESILDDPFPVLMAQAYKERGEAVAEMKADGIEYEERMELLEEVTYPRPLAEPLEQALRLYRETHPWVLETDLSPKSVVRDMYESGRTFTEFVAYYGVARSEGLVLRYLSDAYRALRRTVPDRVKTDELDDLTEWLGETVRQIDSSLLDEWEALTDPESVARAAAAAAAGRALAAAAPDHRQRARVPGDGPQRHVPAGPARGPRPLRRARRARRGRRGADRSARAGGDDRGRVGGARSAPTGTSTRRSTPARPRARRSCC